MRGKSGSGAELAPEGRLRRALAAAGMVVFECDLRTGLVTHEEPQHWVPLPQNARLRQVLRLIHPADRRDVVARARAAVEHRTPYIQHYRLKGSDKADLWIEHRGSVLCDASGRAAALVGAAIDISAHRRALDKLTLADRRKDDFLATLAHELRNPLTAINASAQLLRTEGLELESSAASSCVQVIHRQTRQLCRLVEDLLDLSQVARNRLELKCERTDLRDVLRTAVEGVDERARAHHHEITLSLPERPLILSADPARLVQLFCNLLANAIKYTPDTGRIEVHAERDEGWVTVHVRDSGLGIAGEYLERVFEPFYQIDRPSTQGRRGLGIGLALVQRIAQLHGGSVSVQSEGAGKGSEFTVRLRLLVDEPAAQRLGAEAAAPLHRAQRLRVLVADDDADVAEALALSLQACGHEVRVALDGEQAVHLAAQFQPQAALLDLAMPKKAGHEAAREIRSQPWAAANGLLLVALTGWNARELRERLDMDAFNVEMMKPPDIDALRQLLEAAAESRNVSPH